MQMSDKYDFLRDDDMEEKQMNWTEIREQWLQDINALYGKVKEWLQEPLAEQLVLIGWTEHTISEEGLGTYQAPGLKIFAKMKQIEFIPVGRLIIGAQGRIDIFTDKGDLMLLKTENEGEWILKEKKRGGLHEKWDEKSFLEMMRWAVA